MSLNLNDYFKLGLDSTENATTQPGLINTIRTPHDTSSSGLNRVTFKVPKVGMLTSDSHLNLQFTTNSGNVAPNLVAGALSSVSRFRIIIDNKVLTDLENPSMLEVNRLYSQNTLTQLSDLHQFYLGNNFITDTKASDGLEEFNQLDTKVVVGTDHTHPSLRQEFIGSATASRTYALPLRMLGAQFLEQASLPVFLLGSREMIIELTFHTDCREYILDATHGDTVIAKDAVSVNLNSVELVTTHVQLPDQVEMQQIDASGRKPVAYPLIDHYAIKGTISTGNENVEVPAFYRLNLQNRELHTMLMTFRDANPSLKNAITANQRTDALGDETIQFKMNGINVFERPIDKSCLVYQNLNYVNDNLPLKIPYNAYNCNDFTLTQMNQSTQDLYKDYRGSFHYVGIDVRNGNQGVFGAGTIQQSAFEVDYKVTPRNSSTSEQPIQKNVQRDVVFYPAVSKLLSIGQRTVDISF